MTSFPSEMWRNGFSKVSRHSVEITRQQCQVDHMQLDTFVISQPLIAFA